MFGTNPKTGLTSSILPHTILQEIPSNENRKRKQTEKRQNARDNLEIQAKKMKNLSNAKFSEAKEGSTVQLKIPDIDRGRGHPRSVISVVLNLLKTGSINLDIKVSTDVAGLAILIVIVRYQHESTLLEDLLLCKSLPTRTTGAEIFDLLD
ncbi:hypothetical protein QTP88_029286 [Uroleucon formosanum]